MEIRITCIEGAESGRVHRFQDRRILIGRSSRCDLCLDANEELGVSGQHCLIRIDGDRATLEDQDSTNGTLLAGKPIKKPMSLKNGATFRLGRQGPIFRFEQVEIKSRTRAERLPTAAHQVEPPQARDDGPWKTLFFVSLTVLTLGLAFLYFWRFMR